MLVAGRARSSLARLRRRQAWQHSTAGADAAAAAQARISKDSMSNTGNLVRAPLHLLDCRTLACRLGPVSACHKRSLCAGPWQAAHALQCTPCELQASCWDIHAALRAPCPVLACRAQAAGTGCRLPGRGVLTQVRSRQLWGNGMYTQDSDLVAVLMHQGFFNQHVWQARPLSPMQQVRDAARPLTLGLPPGKAHAGSRKRGVAADRAAVLRCS